MTTGKDLVCAFLHEYMESRDIIKTAELLTEDVQWLGTSEKEKANGKAEVVELLTDELRSDNSKYILDISELNESQMGDESCSLVGICDIVSCDKTQAHFQLRMSFACKMTDCGLKICSAHASLPTPLQKEDEYYPIRFAKERLSQAQYEFMDKSLPSGFLVTTKFPQYKIKFANKMFVKMLGYDNKDEFFSKTKGGALDFVCFDDIDYIGREAKKREGCFDSYEIEYRMLRNDGTYIWVNQCSQHVIDDNGDELVFATYSDITDQKRAQQLLDTALKGYDVSIWEWDIKNLVAYQYINSSRCDTSGINFYKNFPQCLFDENRYHKDSIEKAKNIFRRIRNGEKTVEEVLYTYDSVNDQYWWENVCYTTVFDNDGKPIKAVAVGRDVTANKQAECNAEIQQQKIDIALENSDIYIWEYDIHEHKCIYQSKVMNDLNIPHIMENMPENIISKGLIHADSINDYRKLYKAVENGEKTAVSDIKYVFDGDRIVWKRAKFVTMFNDKGKPVRAIGCSTDLTAMKALSERYNKEMINMHLRIKNTVSSCNLNLTDNLIISGDSKINKNKVIETMQNADELLEFTFAHLIDEKDRVLFSKMLNRSNLIRAFYDGKSEQTIEYKYDIGKGKYQWHNTQVNVMKNPENGKIEAFIYTIDVTDEKIAKEMMYEVTALDYDYLICLDVVNDSYVMVSGSNSTTLPPQTCDAYENECVVYAKEHLLACDREEFVHDMAIANVVENLKTERMYSVYARVIEEGGRIAQKKLRFSYINKKSGMILLTRRDISDIIEKEEAQKENLKNALVAANQANNAKSEFLSRMSHEIRTPMNAIIGMSTLAAQCINDTAQVSECLANVGISARFLLSLINDILDMSRIESGKVLIKQEKIPFEEFINAINAICYSQASIKDVSYDAIITGFTEDYYIGDAMKLQQVLINIISNAIKFTLPGGKVQFIINQEQIKAGEAVMHFTINDTGIGINEEFIPRLFEPFEQEHTGSTSMYSGTGLGLAICKNLLNLMGGNINVNSIEGIGTEFNVEVKLGISDETRKKANFNTEINLEKLKALIVDDDVIVCQNTEKILSDMGLSAEWVTSGQKAVDTVAEKWQAHVFYDIILVDWKMPDMDGIETTRRLRKIVGPDVTIIIMTAYDWISIENEAKKAGVNLLISKPLFKTSLHSAFQKIYIEKDENELSECVHEYDFSGKRVLLVEDHMLNIEVAKRLLMAKGFAVDIAENGLKAIEAFAKSQKGYYDVILMDIRMPVMDGLTAAKSIRQMGNEDAKTIPIVAMTANAFEEDIEKTKSAGMNAHLAKPIEPELLYRTLDEFIMKR